MENSWILSPDNPMSYDFKRKFVGDKGQIQVDPSHNGAVRRLTGNGLKYSDLLGIIPIGDPRIGGFAPEASQDASMPFSTPLPSSPSWKTDSQQRAYSR
jgi:hypothetical protein